MKLLFNVMTLKKGGAERVINILANDFAIDNDVEILTSFKDEISYDFKKNIKISCLEKMNKNRFLIILSRFSIIKLLRLEKEITRINPDIIISFLPEPSLRISILKHFSKRMKEIPVIIAERNDPNVEYRNAIVRLVVKKFFKDIEYFIFQTNDAANFFDGIVKKYEIIDNPIDDKFLKTNYNGIESKRIISVGRLCEQKNQTMLINAFYEFHRKNPEYYLDIYGEGSLYNKLYDNIEKLNLQSSVFLRNNVDNIQKELEKSEMFILSSKYEGMPNALIEAMVVGVPCISTDCPCGGPRSLIINNYNGFLIETNDDNQLIECMQKLSSDINLRKKISNNSQCIVNRVKKDVVIKKWREIINKISERE